MAGGRGVGRRWMGAARGRRLLLLVAVVQVVSGAVVLSTGPESPARPPGGPAALAVVAPAPDAAGAAGQPGPDPASGAVGGAAGQGAGGGAGGELATLAVPAPAEAAPGPAATGGVVASTGGEGAAAARLREILDAELGGVAGCLVVSSGGVELYSRGADDPVTPASTQKLLVAAAALSRLGPDYRFETVVRAPAPPVDGVVEGLVLVGGGDPVLATPEYAGFRVASARTRGAPVTPLVWLADELVAAGVHEVRGGIGGDDSRHDRTRYLPSWKPSYQAEGEVGPLSALMVDGGLDSWRPNTVATADPVAHATSALARLLSERGVGVGAGGGSATASGGVVLARAVSAPLSEIVAAMISASDNVIAELVTRELDVRAGGAGTTAGGAAVVVEEARRLGLPVGGLSLVDGSGLDRGNRATCRSLLGVLGLAGRPRLAPISQGLAVAGRSGTLANRYLGTPLEGRLMAKTGWLSGVAGMVGRVEVGDPVEFAFVGNGEFGWPAAKAMQDRLVSVLAEYRRDG